MSYTYMETEQEGQGRQGRQGRQGGEGHSDIFSYASLPLSPSLPITQSAMQSPVLPASPAPGTLYPYICPWPTRRRSVKQCAPTVCPLSCTHSLWQGCGVCVYLFNDWAGCRRWLW